MRTTLFTEAKEQESDQRFRVGFSGIAPVQISSHASRLGASEVATLLYHREDERGSNNRYDDGRVDSPGTLEFRGRVAVPRARIRG